MADFEAVSPLTPSQEAEIERRVDEVRKRVRDGSPDPQFNGPVDAYDIRENATDQLAGRNRKGEVWEQVMRHHGFVWFEAFQLDRMVGLQAFIPRYLEGLSRFGPGSKDLAATYAVANASSFYQSRKHKEGEWRRTNPDGWPSKNWAFTVTDLASGFESPKAFDDWIREYEKKLSLAKLGIVVTR